MHLNILSCSSFHDLSIYAWLRIQGPQSDGRPNYTVNNNGGQSPAWPDDSETPLVPNRYSFSVEDPSSAPNDTGDADADGVRPFLPLICFFLL